jgi:RimJ/RimL family protein N-acetyltransferase
MEGGRRKAESVVNLRCGEKSPKSYCKFRFSILIMRPATLKTGRLSLNPLGPEHKDALYKLDTNPDVMRYIFTGNPLTAEESTQVFDHLLKFTNSNDGLGCWVGYSGDQFVGWWLLAPSENEVVGEDSDSRRNSTSSASSTSSTKSRLELGMRVTPEFWGKGYAKEGLQALLKYSLEDLQVEEVFGEAMAVNTGSRVTMEKCGLKHVRTWHNTYEEFTPPPGIEEGEVEYRVTREEWLSQGSQS